jgi:hypothetical protein
MCTLEGRRPLGEGERRGSEEEPSSKSLLNTTWREKERERERGREQGRDEFMM